MPHERVGQQAALEIADDLVDVHHDDAVLPLERIGSTRESTSANCRVQYARTASSPCSRLPSIAFGQSTSGCRSASAASRSRALNAS
jgi:hypothetical protein